MNKDPFILISGYCERNNIEFSIRNNAFCIYHILFLDAKKSHKEQNPTAPSDEDIKTSLLTDQAISNYVKMSENILEEASEKILRQSQRSFRWKNFFITTSAGVLGTFLYSLLLLLLFKLGEDQINSWLTSLISK